MTYCIRCRVDGRVQGVWFRATTQRVAQSLSISGSARNMPDGSVEVIACGELASLERLKQWLHQGPEQARVESVECCEVQPDTAPTGFMTG